MATKYTCRCGATTYGRLCRLCWLSELNNKRMFKPLPSVATLSGDVMVCSDLHVPYHSMSAVEHMCDTASLFNVTKLVIAGDLLHVDSLSRFEQYQPEISLHDELREACSLLDFLESTFEAIVVIPGNHDQRVAKALSSLKNSTKGEKALSIIKGLLNQSGPTDVGELATSVLSHYLSSSRVTVHPLPDLLLNDTWLIMHPGTASRSAPSQERKMAHKWRHSILMGHSHLFGIGFDDSATDVAFNIGCMSLDEHFYYKRERPSSYPKPVLGYCAILDNKVLPIAIHDRWLSPVDIVKHVNTVYAYKEWKQGGYER